MTMYMRLTGKRSVLTGTQIFTLPRQARYARTPGRCIVAQRRAKALHALKLIHALTPAANLRMTFKHGDRCRGRRPGHRAGAHGARLMGSDLRAPRAAVPASARSAVCLLDRVSAIGGGSAEDIDFSRLAAARGGRGCPVYCRAQFAPSRRRRRAHKLTRHCVWRCGRDATARASRIATVNMASLPSSPALLPQGEGSVESPPERGGSRGMRRARL